MNRAIAFLYYLIMFGVHNSNAKIVMIKVSPRKEHLIFRNKIPLKQSGGN